MGALKVLRGGGKGRKCHNGKHEEDKELSDFVIPKVNWQHATGKGITLDVIICKNTQIKQQQNHKKQQNPPQNTWKKQSDMSDTLTFCLQILLLIH